MPNLVSLIFRIMSDSQDNLLDFEYDAVQGEDLLNQSPNLEGEPMEEEVVIVEEVQFQPSLIFDL